MKAVLLLMKDPGFSSGVFVKDAYFVFPRSKVLSCSWMELGEWQG